MQLPQGVPAVAEYYDREQYWPRDSLQRRLAYLPRLEAHLAASRQDARLAIGCRSGSAVAPP